VLFCDVRSPIRSRPARCHRITAAPPAGTQRTHGITPQGVKRALQQSLHTHEKEREQAEKLNRSLVAEDVETYDKLRVIAELEEEMREASARLEFERAAHLRDQIVSLARRS
jgi:excinuclease UvrABC helicase subunit UvrB